MDTVKHPSSSLAGTLYYSKKMNQSSWINNDFGQMKEAYDAWRISTDRPPASAAPASAALAVE